MFPRFPGPRFPRRSFPSAVPQRHATSKLPQIRPRPSQPASERATRARRLSSFCFSLPQLPPFLCRYNCPPRPEVNVKGLLPNFAVRKLQKRERSENPGDSVFIRGNNRACSLPAVRAASNPGVRKNGPETNPSGQRGQGGGEKPETEPQVRASGPNWSESAGQKRRNYEAKASSTANQRNTFTRTIPSLG